MFVLAQPLLQGCAPAVVTGIAMGASVIHDRRDATTVIDDQRIELQAMADHFNDPELNSRSRISATSYNYVVLLTGQAQTDEIRQRSAEKVSRLPKVRRVIDEVSLAPSASLARQSEDTLITSRVKLELTSIDLPGFDPMRVKVVTEDGIVYLMGLVSAEEADAAVEKARYVPGVKKVVKVFEYINPSPPQA
jgi:osmotically-inducible protein OsmY